MRHAMIACRVPPRATREERAARWVHPPVLAQLVPQRQETGARRLLAAYLVQAFLDARAGDPDAVAWLLAPSEAPWSCRWACSHLDVDVRAVRRAVVALRQVAA